MKTIRMEELQKQAKAQLSNIMNELQTGNSQILKCELEKISTYAPWGRIQA